MSDVATLEFPLRPCCTGVKTMAEILIIDDDPQMRRLLIRVLNGAGHTVHESTNGREGIELFHRTLVALVITDIVMPDAEGIETIRELRREAPTIPILVISGSGTSVYLRAATKLGATAALAKPFGAAELLSVVWELLDSGRPASTLSKSV
jgi:DNA-binding NtrC family response regulator